MRWKPWSVLFFSVIAYHVTMAQTPSPESVVQANLDAYNRRDWPLFMSFFPDSIALYTFPQANPQLAGKQAVGARYKQLFDASPNLHSEILSRMIIGNRVIDHERITGRMGSPDPVYLVMIYDVEGDRITRMTAVRP
jgi:hypothetical protein